MLEKFINKIICGDALEVLKEFPSRSVDMVLTSPPYYGLRDYGIEGQIGLEKTPEEYVLRLKEVFKEIFRVLKKTGTFWLNIGDTYGGSGCGKNDWRNNNKRSVSNPMLYANKPSPQLKQKPKCLLCIPERLMFACLELGFILRNKIVWYKPNHMPSSVKDRFTNSWEYLYFFSKARKYFFDLDAVREPHKEETRNLYPYRGTPQTALSRPRHLGEFMHPLGKNPGDVIRLSPKYLSGKGHTNRQGLNRPLDLVTIKAYKEYQKPIAKFLKRYIKPKHKLILDKTFGKHKWRHWIRTDFSGASLPGVEDWWKLKEILKFDDTWDDKIYEVRKLNIPIFQSGRVSDFWEIPTQPFPEAHFAVFPEKLCERPIKAGCPKNGIVLDPFCGSGTTLIVAKKLGRNYIGIDLKPEYCEMAKRRIAKVPERLDRFVYKSVSI